MCKLVKYYQKDISKKRQRGQSKGQRFRDVGIKLWPFGPNWPKIEFWTSIQKLQKSANWNNWNLYFLRIFVDSQIRLLSRMIWFISNANNVNQMLVHACNFSLASEIQVSSFYIAQASEAKYPTKIISHIDSLILFFI